MSKTWTTIIIILLIIIVGVWIWSANRPATAPVVQTPSGELGTNSSTSGQTNTGEPSVAPVLHVANDPTLGSYLTAANGMTLYLYTPDKPNVSNCTGGCIAAWPAYIVSTNEPLMAEGNATGTLGTITRSDGGGTQLTYNGIPLYFFKQDQKVGDVKGQGIGNVWYVVKP